MSSKGEEVPAAIQPTAAQVSEGSLKGSFVALLTPIFAVAAGWLAGVVGKAIPGVELDPNQIIAFMVATTTAVLTASYKWVQGWQEHEHRVSEQKAPAIKPAVVAATVVPPVPPR